MKLVSLLFVKESLAIGMPVPHSCFVRQSFVDHRLRQLSQIVSVKNGTIECIITGERRCSTDLQL